MEETTPSDEQAAIDIGIKDVDLLREMRTSVEASEKFWNENPKFKLKETIENNMNLYLPNHWKGKEVYEHEKENLYQDPRIFISVETIMGMVASKPAYPEVAPDEDTVIARKLAGDVQEACFAHAKKYRVDDLQGVAGRNMIIKRIGWIKLRYDSTIDDIKPEVCDPLDITVDKDARFMGNPRFIAHRIRNKPAEELIAMFPGGEQAILKAWGCERQKKNGDLVAYKSQLSKRKDVWEIWFTYYKDGPKEGLMVCDYDFQNMFFKGPNPNWNYEEEEDSLTNFLDTPPKPFIEFVYLSDGITFIPPTSAVEQAAGLQKNLDKRGKQIIENADQSAGGIVFSTDAMTKEEAEKLIGAPDERVGVKGKVTDAMMRLAPNLLPTYVIEDKVDARNEIDAIFGTHKPTRGESTNRTATQDVLQQQQDLTRQDEISRALQRAMSKYYQILVQMMKVYYREDHWFKVNGEDGQFDFIVMRSDLIRDGIDVSVQTGSMAPPDKISERSAVMQLLQADMVDPMTVYETLGIPNPKKTLERTIKWKLDPMSFSTEVQDETFERQAFMDIQMLNRGEFPKLRGEITPRHLEFHRQYMSGGEYDELEDNIKNLHLEHVKMEMQQANKLLQTAMSQAPTQPELDAAAKQETQQAQSAVSMGVAQPAEQPPGAAPAPQGSSEQQSNSGQLPIA